MNRKSYIDKDLSPTNSRCLLKTNLLTLVVENLEQLPPLIEQINFLLYVAPCIEDLRMKPCESTECQDCGYGEKFVYRKQMILM